MAEPPFTIATYGETNEQRYWRLFAAEAFPSYETFWAAEIVPLTNRTRDRRDVRIQQQEDLDRIGKTEEDVTVAQLHLTLLLHLGRVFQLLRRLAFDRHTFTESFVALTGASDVADELLQRRETPGVYAPWNEKAGSDARKEWRRNHGDPLRDVRAYRNRLVHGRVVPELHVTRRGFGLPPHKTLHFPRIEKLDEYLDWRKAQTQQPILVRFVVNDFREGRAIVQDAWQRVVFYAERSWQTHPLSEAGPGA